MRSQKTLFLFLLIAAIMTPVMAQNSTAAPASTPAKPAPVFKVGYAETDITPQAPMPMWGYGDRHAMLSQGVRNPMFARAMVIDTGASKLAIVGMDLGRGPTRWMMPEIREGVKAAGITSVMIAGSHTHHGPVIELRDEPGKGKGVFDDAVYYAQTLPGMIVDVINKAAAATQDAKIGWGLTKVDLNHNRHSKIEPKPVDPDLQVLRIDNLEGKPQILLVNFAAHPTNLDDMELLFSSEYPGQMILDVQKAMGDGGHCMFMQGACGDLSPNKPAGAESIEAYGQLLADKVMEVAKGIETRVPEKPSIQVADDTFTFSSRIPLDNPMLQNLFKQAFFPELIAALDEVDGKMINAPMTTVLLNDEIGLVGVPGEFFCNHSNRLKERSRTKATFFFGYCNGHYMYFPTVEGAAEGGYGADATVSWVELGAGERMMDKALINLYTMMGKYRPSLPGMN